MTNTQTQRGAEKVRQIGATSLTVSGALAWIVVNIIIVLPGVDVGPEWATGMTAALSVVFKGFWEFAVPFIPKPPLRPRP